MAKVPHGVETLRKISIFAQTRVFPEKNVPFGVMTLTDYIYWVKLPKMGGYRSVFNHYDVIGQQSNQIQ